MDRLTGRDAGIAYFQKCFEEPCNGGGCDNPNCPIISHWVCERLAAYEDTGLTPDEVEALKSERDRFKARAEAAVNSLVSLMVATREGCRLCENAQCFERNGTRPCEPILRGPCTENGGT